MIHSVHDTYTLRSGGALPAVGYGVWDDTFAQDTYTQVRNALDVGYRHIDTAAFYRNEEAVGDAVRDSDVPREDIFITTKIWPTEFVRADEAFSDSMKKLHLDYVDMYMLHWPGVDEALMLNVWEKMIAWREEGRIRALGGSNLHEIHMNIIEQKTGVPVENDQIELHPWRQQRELAAWCKKHDILVTAWGPLFHGHLKEEPLLDEIGARYGVSAAQATLHWHVRHGNIIIPKSSKKERMISNLDILDFTLSDEDMALIDGLDGKGSFGFDAMTFDGNE
ncbi:MAG: aldo/keto reductase [Clostridiales Family XIII bacterium]|jgi:diketogulonate reductase-like aldo/keto reductase|nr:aldo/keto reductase [Clostridiales Family XIII bacterium]